MSALLVVLALSAAPIASSANSEQSAGAQAEPRAYHELSNDLYDFMKREALAQSHAERAAAIREMAVLYRELARDPRLVTSDTLKEYKAKLWSRLIRVKKDLEQQIAREKKQAERDGTAGKAQLSELAAQSADEASQGLAAQMALVSYSMGGPARVLAESGGAFGGGPRDDGKALVDLIQRTIAPDFWDINGGPGAIVYYQPLHVLVISATDEVHGNLGGLLNGLRDAGR
jgi:hypothetical protein